MKFKKNIQEGADYDVSQDWEYETRSIHLQVTS